MMWWAVLTVCFGLADADCQQRYLAEPFIDARECAAAVTATGRMIDAAGGTCMTKLPTDAQPLPAATPGIVHADATVSAPCTSSSIMADGLKERYGERPIWYGLSKDHFVSLWIGEHSWTIVTSMPSGDSCLSDSGGRFWFRTKHDDQPTGMER